MRGFVYSDVQATRGCPAFTCAMEFCGPWQLSHWMFASFATCGAMLTMFVHPLGIMAGGIDQLNCAIVSSKPAFATPRSKPTVWQQMQLAP